MITTFGGYILKLCRKCATSFFPANTDVQYRWITYAVSKQQHILKKPRLVKHNKIVIGQLVYEWLDNKQKYTLQVLPVRSKSILQFTNTEIN
jgi:hypothetical protein